MFCLYKVLSYIVYSLSMHEVLSYTAKLQFPCHSRLSESIPVSSPYTPKKLFYFQVLRGGFELYGKSTVSFSPCLGGSTPVSSPYTQLDLSSSFKSSNPSMISFRKESTLMSGLVS